MISQKYKVTQAQEGEGGGGGPPPLPDPLNFLKKYKPNAQTNSARLFELTACSKA